jgi:integrase
VIEYLHDLHEEITVRSIHNYACRLKRALELMCPDADWSWFRPILRNLERRARAARSAVRPFVPADQLSAFGTELMDLAETGSAQNDLEQAELFRDGLIIAFLASRPLRLKNMLELEIGTHLSESNTGYEVSLPPEKTKTKSNLEFPLPAMLVPAIQRYLSYYRGVLAAGRNGSLVEPSGSARFMWLARSGAQFPIASFEDMVSRRTTERFNQRLTPHAFRHCVATSIAQFDPEQFHIIRIVLGHTTMATADKHYIHAKGIESARLVQAAVRTKRKELSRQLKGAGSTR